MKKLDIMKMKDGENGWKIEGDKVTKVENIIEKPIDKNLKIEGPVVKESIEVVNKEEEEEEEEVIGGKIKYGNRRSNK
jgi:hypothetical protein